MSDSTKRPYLPKARTGYHPTKDSIENEVEIDAGINIPNPANDPIVVNNIACQEFDYTEDLTDEVIPSSENNTYNNSNKTDINKKLF